MARFGKQRHAVNPCPRAACVSPFAFSDSCPTDMHGHCPLPNQAARFCLGLNAIKVSTSRHAGNGDEGHVEFPASGRESTEFD